jgi:acetylornithine deacetylase/succinyl-diaminopimelate desuccinylase-like protein
MFIKTLTGGSSLYNIYFQQALQIPIATLGAQYPEGNLHGPNENIRWNDYLKTARYLVRLLDEFGRLYISIS